MSNENIKFATCGENVKIYPNSVFISPENIYLQNNIMISEFCWFHGGIKTFIGNFIHIHLASISGGGVCLLEDFVGVSAGSRIITGTELVDGSGLTNPMVPIEYRALTRSFVHLKKHSFLASNTVVHPGVTIGEGAVIASNSVVTKDIEPWTINMGTPAKPVRKRPSEKIKKFEKELYTKSNILPYNFLELEALKCSDTTLPQ